MINEDDLNFLIGGNINEPVAMEIPFKCESAHITALINLLRDHGLEIDLDGKNPEKFSLTKPDQYNYCSLITPAMKPSELKDTFRLIEKLFAIFYSQNKPHGVTIANPHILDLKNLVTQHNMEKDNELNELIQSLLKEAEESKELIKFKYPSKDLQKHFQKSGHLFSGTAMSDPYVVATAWHGKYLRYASWDPDDAARYNYVCGWTKNLEFSFCNKLPNGQPVGFLHEYEARSDQRYYPDFGIQTNGAGSLAQGTETMVNRFNNPVVATYVLWRKPYDDNIYMIKIPENDPDWEKFKDYYKASYFEQDTIKRNKINSWIAEGEKHKTYLPWKDKTKNAHDMLKSINQAEQEKAIKQQQAEEHKEQLVAKIKDLLKKINQIEDSKKLFTIYQNKSCSYYDGIIKEIKDAISEYNKRISVLKTLEQKAEILKQEAEIFEQESRTSGIYFELKHTGADYNLILIAEKIQQNRTNISNAEKDIEYAKKEKSDAINETAKRMKYYPAEILKNNIEPEVKKALMEGMRKSFRTPLDKTDAEILSDTIINLYIISSPQERISFKTYFEYIKENASKEVLKILIKRAKSRNYDIIADSVRTPFGEKIKRIFGFAKGKQKLIDKSNEHSKHSMYSNNPRE